MKVFLLVCLGLLLVVSSGWGDAAVDKEDKLSLKTLDTPALKDPSAGIPSLRNIREAEKKKGKQGKNKNDKKKTSKSKKNKGRKRKNSKGNAQKKKNKKSVKGQNQKRKGKKNKKKKQTRKKNKKKKQTRKKNKKKSQTRKKNKKRTSAKEKNKGKNKNPTKVKQENKKQKSGKGKNNSRKSKKGKNSRKKIKQAARKNKKKTKKSKTKSGRNAKKSKTGKNKSKQQSRLTCGSTQVNDTCLQNAVDALNFEKNQIQNFFKQKARLINHNKTTASKQGKKGEFEDAAKYLLQAIGGNLSAPTCGESGTAQKARSAKSASDTYKTLLNCSVSIKEACTMPTKTFNATIQATLDTCAGIYNISKMTSDTCRTESAFLSNGTLACECWSKAAIGIVLAKKNNCAATDTAKAVKKAKNKCIAAFSVCKKAEDSAVGLIHTCMAGEVKNISATGEPIPSPVAAAAPVPAPIPAPVSVPAPIPAPVSVPAPVPVPVPVTAILTTVTTTPAPDCKCGIKKTRRIVGGKETEINEYPWMAAITNAAERFFCGGTLITSQWVLTATHCMWKDQQATQEVGVTEIRVVLGDHDNTISTENIIPRIVKEVSQIERHPKYSYVTSDYDIALIKLKDEVDLKVYTPACLPAFGDTFVGQKAWVYGWGTTSFGGSVSNKLLEVQVPVISKQVCKTVMQNTITNRMLCAGGELNKDGCQGDSGGPLTVEKDGKHYLIGDVSFGNGCGQQGQYGVYGNVAFFRDTFINTTIEDAKNCA